MSIHSFEKCSHQVQNSVFYSCCMCLHDRPIRRLAPKIDLLQAIEIQLCKFRVLEDGTKRDGLSN